MTQTSPSVATELLVPTTTRLGTIHIARTTVGVTGLAVGAKVEIDLIARRP